MASKFQNKYRIPSTRLQNWDYRSNAAYFITICTQNREHFFGKIKTGKMILSEIGIMAEKYWMEIPNHFIGIELGNFVIMPNHIHGIIIINNPAAADVETLHCNVSIPTIDNVSPTIDNLPNPDQPKSKMASITPKPGSLSVIIRSYKSVVSNTAKIMLPDFGWQPRFYDHIIRNARSYDNIQNYIQDNPKNWNNDEFY